MMPTSSRSPEPTDLPVYPSDHIPVDDEPLTPEEILSIKRGLADTDCFTSAELLRKLAEERSDDSVPGLGDQMREHSWGRIGRPKNEEV